MTELVKKKRHEDLDLIEYIKHNCPCIVCERFPDENFQVFAHHVKHRGASGGDYIWNLMPLCVQHHTEIHALGTSAMARIHKNVKKWLVLANWELDHRLDKWIFGGELAE